jgi:hypothetical protein
MKKPLLWLFFACICQIMPAQTLLPFLSQNGKYGFADELGQIILAPEFEGRVEPFLEKTLAIDCQKNGQTIRLFRSGLQLPNPHLMMGRVLPVLNFNENNVRLDSIGHLVAVRVEQKIRIIDLRTGGKIAETYQEDFLNLPKWAKMRGMSQANSLDVRFLHGILRIYRADGSVNFLDENLREILPKDLAAGAVLDAQHLLFAEGKERFGLMDRSGKTLVAPVFRSLEPSGRPGYFIANKQRDGSIGEKWSCGLVRADGKMVLDTVYSDIEKVEGADLLIVRKTGKTGLFDFEGREIVPIEAEYGYKQGFGFSIFKWPNGQGVQLFDRNGKRVLEGNAAEVTTSQVSNQLFFKVKKGGWTSILDTSMMVLVRDSVENLDLIDADPLLFMLRKNGRQSRLVSIRDASGKTLVDGKFESVYTPVGWPNGLRLSSVSQLNFTQLKGIFDKQFKEVLPTEFTEITLEISTLDTIIWAKRRNERLFMAYDLSGVKREDISSTPEPRRESVFGVVAKLQAIPGGKITTIGDNHIFVPNPEDPQGGGTMATMFDGTQLKWPDSLQNQRILASYRSKDIGVIVVGFDSKHITTVLDHRFRKLLPEGYGVPKNVASEAVLERFQQFGLLTVQKLPEVKPRVRPVQTPKPKPNEPATDAPGLVISDAPVEEYPVSESPGLNDVSPDSEPMSGAPCGVLDLDGKLLLEPKAGVEYLVLSPFLVAEFPAGAKSSSHQFFEKGLRLHRVQQAEKGSFDAHWLGRDRFASEDGNNMKIGRIRAGTTRMAEYAYFDLKGSPLTDWIFENGPDYLRSKNLVHIWEKGSLSARQAVIDARGKRLFELGKYMTEDPPHARMSDWNLSYLVVHERKAEENLPEGLMDSTGKLVLPLQYQDLLVWENDRFLSAKTTTGKLVLMTLDGRIIHEFKAGQSSILMQYNGRDSNGANAGPLVVWTEDETILIDANNKVLWQYDLPFVREFLSKKMADRYVVLLKNNQKVWADFRSGKLFWE